MGASTSKSQLQVIDIINTIILDKDNEKQKNIKIKKLSQLNTLLEYPDNAYSQLLSDRYYIDNTSVAYNNTTLLFKYDYNKILTLCSKTLCVIKKKPFTYGQFAGFVFYIGNKLIRQAHIDYNQNLFPVCLIKKNGCYMESIFCILPSFETSSYIDGIKLDRPCFLTNVGFQNLIVFLINTEIIPALEQFPTLPLKMISHFDLITCVCGDTINELIELPQNIIRYCKKVKEAFYISDPPNNLISSIKKNSNDTMIYYTTSDPQDGAQDIINAIFDHIQHVSKVDITCVKNKYFTKRNWDVDTRNQVENQDVIQTEDHTDSQPACRARIVRAVAPPLSSLHNGNDDDNTDHSEYTRLLL